MTVEHIERCVASHKVEGTAGCWRMAGPSSGVSVVLPIVGFPFNCAGFGLVDQGVYYVV